MKEIIYEPHPVAPERKQELLGQGYKIIDARFAPADYVSDKPKEATTEKPKSRKAKK